MLLIAKSTVLKIARGLLLAGDHDFSPIFVCGIAGSGNSLLASLLHEQYEVAGFANESALYAPHRSPFRIRSSTRFDSLKAFRDAMDITGSPSTSFLRQQLTLHYRREADFPKRRNVIVDKAPNTHMIRVRELHRSFPEARFVLIFRNPMSHVLSMRKKWKIFRRASLEEVCAFWSEMHLTFLRRALPVQKNLFGMAYEDLIENTEARCATIAAAAGLRRRMQARGRGNRPNRPGHGLRNVSGGRIQILRNTNSLAQDGASGEEQSMIDSMCMPLYSRMKLVFDQSSCRANITPQMIESSLA